jgi:hypothetical protein
MTSVYFTMANATGQDKLGPISFFASRCPMVIIFFLRLYPLPNPFI